MVIEMESFQISVESHVVEEGQANGAAVFDSVISQHLRIVFENLIIKDESVSEIIIQDSILERSDSFSWTADDLNQRVCMTQHLDLNFPRLRMSNKIISSRQFEHISYLLSWLTSDIRNLAREPKQQQLLKLTFYEFKNC